MGFLFRIAVPSQPIPQECRVYAEGSGQEKQYCADVCHPKRCGRDEECKLTGAVCAKSPCPPKAKCKKHKADDRCNGECDIFQVGSIAYSSSHAKKQMYRSLHEECVRGIRAVCVVWLLFYRCFVVAFLHTAGIRHRTDHSHSKSSDVFPSDKLDIKLPYYPSIERWRAFQLRAVSPTIAQFGPKLMAVYCAQLSHPFSAFSALKESSDSNLGCRDTFRSP